MLLTDAVQYLAQALYVGVFGVTLAQATRRPTRAGFEVVLLFGAAALLVLVGVVVAVLGIAQVALIVSITAALLMALPYLLLRLAASFSEVPALVLNGAAACLALTVVAVFLSPQPFPLWLTLALVVYFVVVAVIASVVFVRQAGRATGVTRRRLQSVAWGSALLGLDIFVAGLGALLPAMAGFWTVLGGLLGLGSGVLYFVGFAPPVWLRRTWQEPALRAFLLRSAQLVREPDTRQVVRDLEERAAMALGARATLGMWNQAEGRLVFHLRDRNLDDVVDRSPHGYAVSREREVLALQPGTLIAGRAFERQQLIYSADAARDDPDNAEIYRRTGSQAAMAAPISVGTQRLGVLVAYAARAPVFADSDLELLELMADQAAVVLQSRALIEESSRARAREEANRLKDEFLANISHDLRNPLTAVQGVAQVLERRMLRDSVVDPTRLSAALTNIRGSTAQMASLIDQLLDYARMQMDRPLELTLTSTDLVELARRTVDSYAAASDRHRVRFQAPASPIVGEWDAARLERVVQNLVGNALKYSPDGGEVLVRAATEADAGRRWAVVAVEDHGLGIPPEDLPHIFDRFHRAANVGEIRGSGLGLAAARQVVEQHGGSLSVTSEVGLGSTFVVRLPLSDGQSPEPPAPPPESAVAQPQSSIDLNVALNGGFA